MISWKYIGVHLSGSVGTGHCRFAIQQPSFMGQYALYLYPTGGTPTDRFYKSLHDTLEEAKIHAEAVILMSWNCLTVHDALDAWCRCGGVPTRPQATRVTVEDAGHSL